MVSLALSGKVLCYRLGSDSEDHDHYGPLWLLPLALHKCWENTWNYTTTLIPMKHLS